MPFSLPVRRSRTRAACPAALAAAALWNALAPSAPAAEPSARAVLHVSKLGDDSDGSSWAKAFRTIQAALLAVPDDRGGHRIIVRPDTYVEANLHPAHAGAVDAYNTLEADVDGRLGSGARGRVVVDSGDPEAGFKSYDWWSTFRATQKGWSKEHTEPTFSGIIWDRWIVRGFYVTGSDAGLFWDLTDRSGSPFTIVVEDSVGIGRAFGGGFAGAVGRKGEPSVFRRSHLLSLDWWGDAGGVYARAHNESMPAHPDAVFEDCALVGPDNALQAGNPGFDVYTRLRLERCRLVVLNFSQPRGTPSSGIINSRMKGEHVHLDFEDCTLMGYKVFGSGDDEPIPYTTAGSVSAYVQFEQPVPDGFHRLGHWPVEVFQSALPPAPSPPRPEEARAELVRRDLCELSPIVWKDRLAHLECIRPSRGGRTEDYYLLLKDAASGTELARFAQGYGLASAHVEDGTLHVFASRFEDGNWNDVTHFRSDDLESWESSVAIRQENEHLFNSSVCRGPDGFVMAYESNDAAYPAFTTKFAVSDDLERWRKLPDAVFGTDRYTACPCIRWSDGHYYLLYLERRAPRWFFETWIARSSDLLSWQLSRANPVLTPRALEDGINASDPDLVTHDGRTYLYYAVGDQRTWMHVKRAVWPGSERRFFEGWFREPGITDTGAAGGR